MTLDEQKLPLKHADVIFIKNFYTKEQADNIYSNLLTDIAWTQKEFEGRKTALYGTTPEYKYALNVGHPIDWNTLPILEEVAKDTSKYTNIDYDVCLANYYADGNDKFNFHADKEEIGKNTPICSLSFGAERKFYFKAINKSNTEQPNEHDDNEKLSIVLTHGSLLIIPSVCHEHYLHALPRDHKIKTPRINLTFRKTI
jgi:alkylated DNA repair dioxygenase AlkB